MVAGDHDRLDTSLSADLDGLLGFRAQRIDHAHKAHEGQAAFKGLGSDLGGHFSQFLVGNS